MYIVNVEVIERYLQAIAEINAMKLADIEWHKDGIKIDISPEEVEEWKFVGLSNVCFMKQSV